MNGCNTARSTMYRYGTWELEYYEVIRCATWVIRMGRAYMTSLAPLYYYPRFHVERIKVRREISPCTFGLQTRYIYTSYIAMPQRE